MSARDDGGLAFPSKRMEPLSSDWPSTVEIEHPGMSLRDWFAGQYLAASHSEGSWDIEQIAAESYRMADAMLAERSKP